MNMEEEKTLNEKSEMQQSAEENLPGQQLGQYSDADKKDVRHMVDELNPDKNSLDSRG